MILIGRVRFYLLWSILTVTPSTVFANPVSFKDGWGIMPTFTSDWSDVDINYSLTSRDALGVSEFDRNGRETSANFGIVRYNRLIKRWNEIDSQANIYASVGVGGALTARDDAFAGYAALESDYETRRVYTLFGVESLQSSAQARSRKDNRKENRVQFNRLRYRAGVAPYTAPFDSLHTWLIVQVDYMPEMEDRVVVTPMLRLFYNNLALEVGIGFNGQPSLGAMAHF